ncbi:MAG TPA: ATP-binding protein [Actinomycetota bacterium]|nr:ATP-binding protein [Actinomycetota bacterium]
MVDAAGGPARSRADDEEPRSEGFRWGAQLNMLHNLAATLNTFDDVRQIGESITAELRTIIDYHNCRVYLLEPNGHTLTPIAFRGELFDAYGQETLDELLIEMGEGMTGWVAEHRTSLLTPNAQEVEFAVQIEGTDDITESMLLVPMLVGEQVVGVIVLSSLGYGKFDEEDQRLLEVLAAHAAVAFQNARLLGAEREAAATSVALLELSQTLTGRQTIGDILQDAVESVPSLVPAAVVAAYVRDAETGGFRVARVHEIERGTLRPRSMVADVPREVAESFLKGQTHPFIIPKVLVEQIPEELWLLDEARDVLIAPLDWDPDGFGALVIVAESGRDAFDDRDLRYARGLSDIASLALGNARRLSELERFHELVDSLDAVFWEADAATMVFTFLGGRLDDILGAEAAGWPNQSVTWGSHIAAADREGAIQASRAAIDAAQDHTVEYRVITSQGSTLWLRDLVHVVRGAQGPKQLRGLMVDVTDRKRAEQALRKSERKYSEAFRREREAAQRLRALDDMKNTFLEAVSHDLRTPLTSILGSALTLEQTRFELPKAESLDLVHRVASNARKLERLLSDLLDLDRLQRGIVSPQRRPTDLAALVARTVDELEDRTGHEIDVDVEAVTVSVDAAKVERIIENLLSNAIRHTPPATRIWLRASSLDGGLMLVVEDEGPGVPDDLREAVFEPFRQAPGSSSEHSPGVGVGLSLVRRFAELHGGRAWLEARDGGGASFQVFLPGG